MGNSVHPFWAVRKPIANMLPIKLYPNDIFQGCLLLSLLFLAYQAYYLVSVNIGTPDSLNGHIVLYCTDVERAVSQIDLFYFPDNISEADQ